MAYDLTKWIGNERQFAKRKRWLPWVLLASMLIIAAIGVLETFDNGVDRDRAPNMLPFAFVVLATSASPFARDSWFGPHTQRAFDEFELAAVFRATTRAYSVLLSLLVALFSWLWLADVNGWPMPRTPLDWSSLAFAMFAIGAALPTLCAELMVPLPPEADPQDE